MKEKSWLKSPWAISIGTTILGFILTIVFDSIKNKPILSTIGLIMHFIWSIIINVLNFRLRVWWLLVSLLTIILILYLISKFQNIKPDFYNYTEGVIKQWKWSWRWKWNSYDKVWEIADLNAHCPKCDTYLMHYVNPYDSDNYNCPRCNFQAPSNQSEDEREIKVLILDNINRKRDISAKSTKNR